MDATVKGAPGDSDSLAMASALPYGRGAGVEDLNLLMVCPSDGGGGAEAIARALMRLLPGQVGHSRLAVGTRLGDDPQVIAIPNDACRSLWARSIQHVVRRLMAAWGPHSGAGLIEQSMLLLGEPARWIERQRGHEDFHYPGSHRLDRLERMTPDLIHAHNLHGDYFDLRILPDLSHRVPFALTLHDAWMLTGHCAHSIDCDRWRSGCGRCPDLGITPAIRRDGTAYNWTRKRNLYRASRLYVAAPSEWLMRQVEQSILQPAVRLPRVIPNGVDLDCFYPGDRLAAREALDLPADAAIAVFAARGIRNNPWKDFATLRGCVEQLGARWAEQRPLVFVALGESGPTQQFGRAVLRFEPFRGKRDELASFYRAADVYVHAARADTFPNTVLEALACGLPVIATAVGGIPEQVRSLSGAPGGCDKFNIKYDLAQATGALSASRDSTGLAVALEFVLTNNELRTRLGRNARNDARLRFDEQRMVGDYLDWYGAIREDRRAAMA